MIRNFYRKYRYSLLSLIIIFLGHGLVIISGIHFSDYDEGLLWILVALLCIGINYFVNLRRRHLEEQNKIHATILFASNHILRNLLNQIQLMRHEALETTGFNHETIDCFDESVAEAEELIKRLSCLKSLSQENIHESLMRPVPTAELVYKKREQEKEEDNAGSKTLTGTSDNSEWHQMISLTERSSKPVWNEGFWRLPKASSFRIFTWILLGFTSSAISQVGVGTTTPNSSSVLDITANNRGVLLPRVPLLSETDVVTVANPAHSVLVYNTNSASDVTPGFYYWDSFIPKWVRLNNSTGILSAKFENDGSDDDNYCGDPTDLEIFGRTVWNDDTTLFRRRSDTELEVTLSGKYRIVVHTFLQNDEDDDDEYMAAVHQVYINGSPEGVIVITGVMEDEKSNHNTDGAVLIDTFELNAGDLIRIRSQAEDQASLSEAECEFASDGTSNITITRIRDL